MSRTHLFALSIPYVALLFFYGCSDIKPIWKDEVKLSPQGYTLYFDEPCEFKIKVKTPKEKIRGMLELAISYYINIGHAEIPLFMALEDENHTVTEYSTTVKIREQGELLGYPEENEVDYTITHIAIPEIEMKPGKYSLKIYSNDENSAKIEGIVKITARLYEIVELEE